MNSISQLFWQGTTAAASRGITAELVRAGDTLKVRNSVDHSIIRELELPAGVTTTIPDGGPLLLFRAPGRIEFVTGGLVSPFELRALGTRYRSTLSIIGEVRREVVR